MSAQHIGRNGQGTLEYILILIVILLAIIAGSQKIKTAVDTSVFQQGVDGRITSAAGALSSAP